MSRRYLKNPRDPQGGCGDFFIWQACIISLSIHLLIFGLDWSRSEAGQGHVFGHAVSASLVQRSPVQPVIHDGQAGSYPVTRETGTRAASNRPEPASLPGVEADVASAMTEAEVDDVLREPPDQELTAYRLALGRALGGLIDADLRAALSAGTLRFQLVLPVGGVTPEIMLVGGSEVQAERLLNLARQAVEAVPTPSAWNRQARKLPLLILVSPTVQASG